MDGTCEDAAMTNGLGNVTMRRLMLETSSLTEPGADRGLGRYTRAFRAAYAGNADLDLLEISARGIWSLPRQLAKADDGMQSPFHSTSAYSLPIVKTRPWICSVQDIIPLDLNDYSNLGLKSSLAFKNACRSDFIVANSNYTASRIVAKLKYPLNRIVKIPLPVDPIFSSFRPGRAHREMYFSALVDLRAKDPRKRSPWLGPISEMLKREGLSLRVAGRGLQHLARIAPAAVRVEAPTDHDLAKFYAKSLGFIYTSAYEGQGLPPLEAMASGTPIIAFKNTSVSEMVGVGQIMLDDPVPWELQDLDREISKESLQALVLKIRELVSDHDAWASYSADAVERSADFGLDRFNREVNRLARKAVSL